MSGFTYNGVHSSAYGVEWIPNADDKWFQDAEFENYDIEAGWHHGGYYFGSFAKTRKITLKCFFEGVTVPMREGIRRWLKRGTVGRLILDAMPFVYFICYPDAVVQGKIYRDRNCAGEERFSGTFNVTFRAASPFGYLIRKYNTVNTDDNSTDFCSMILNTQMPSAPTTLSRDFYVFNPGTERCGLTIELSGTAPVPFRFFNEANGTYCELIALPPSGLNLAINGDTGYVKVRQPNATSYDNGFAYHEKGFIELEPDVGHNDIAYEDAVKLTNSSYSLKLVEFPVSPDMIGARLTVGNITGTVTSISGNNNVVYVDFTYSTTISRTTGVCNIISQGNHIVIQEKNSNDSWVNATQLTLTSISVDYQPRVL